jgi:hypothetical protein
MTDHNPTEAIKTITSEMMLSTLNDMAQFFTYEPDTSLVIQAIRDLIVFIASRAAPIPQPQGMRSAESWLDKIMRDSPFPSHGVFVDLVRAIQDDVIKNAVSHWQPIGTAPENTWMLACGTDELTGHVEGLPMGVCKRKSGIWISNEAEGIEEPTHWMPLPAAPKAGEM